MSHSDYISDRKKKMEKRKVEKVAKVKGENSSKGVMGVDI